MNKFFISLFLCFIFTAVHSQEKYTENTIKLTSESPKSNFDDISWIAGHWKGEAFGGEFEETWLPPFGDSMMGVFKMIENGETDFMEILRIVENNGSLLLQLKHFDKDFVGWEEKDKLIEFPLVKIDDKRIYFDGITFEKMSEDQINVYLAIKHKDGTIEEILFSYHK